MVLNVFFRATVGELASDCRAGLVDGERMITSAAYLDLFVTSRPDESNEEPPSVGLAKRQRFPFFLDIARWAYSAGTR